MARRLLRRAILLVILAAGLSAGYFFWFRDLSIFAVEEVRISGLHAENASRVQNALGLAARDMTTLHVRRAELIEAARPFPTVKTLRAKADFPTGLAIRVVEHVPVGLIRTPARSLAVAGDGTLLIGMSTKDRRLPLLSVERIPAGRRLTLATALAQARILGAASAALRPHLERVYAGKYGWSVATRGGVKLYFGDSGRARAKWAAAIRILADPESKGLGYIDLRSPERPAVGGLPGAPVSAAPTPTPATPAPTPTTPSIDPAPPATNDPAPPATGP